MNDLNIITRHFSVSHLAKLISSLIILSFKHQNLIGGLDALSITLLHAILKDFTGTSGLHTNISKCQLTREDQVALVHHLLPCKLVHFSSRYLGIPLSVYEVKKSELQSLVDVVAGRLPAWKAKLMSRAGRTSLTKSTLSALLVHVSIVVRVCPRIYREIDKLERAFIWIGTAVASGGQRKIAWSLVTRLVELGGAGSAGLGYTHCMRWEWLARTHSGRTWNAIDTKAELAVHSMFDASVHVQVGDGL
jgi:hypothetical protein